MESRAAAWQTHGGAASDFRIAEVKPFKKGGGNPIERAACGPQRSGTHSGEVNVAGSVEDGGPWC